MARDPAAVASELVGLLRELSRRGGRPAGDPELRSALAPLRPDEEKALRRLGLAEPRAAPLGPFAWVDIARGVDPAMAAARELSGYYALQAERDALAALVGKPATAPPSSSPAVVRVPEKQKGKGAPKRAPPKRAARTDAARTDELLGLFAYHRDAPSVARALRSSLGELEAELDALGIRRRAFRLTRGTYFDMPLAKANPAAPRRPSVRRRSKAEKAPPAEPPPPTEKEQQAAELRRLLAEVGPRRGELGRRLGVTGGSDATLLARFRAAGLERELALRERDLLRALYLKHRGATGRVAAELGVAPEKLAAIVRERGLSRELDRLSDGYRREARNRGWPRGRIEQVLKRREYLEALGVYEELEREVVTRARMLWQEVRERPRALEELRRALELTRDDVDRLRRLADLR